MPILFILLLVLAIKSLTLKDSYKGVEFLFKTEFKTFFDNKSAVLYAIGHSFFSLSIVMAIMITYGSYVDKKENLFSSVFKVAVLDTLVAVISGLIIFPAVFSFGLEPSESAGLVFVSLPNIFNSMIGGQFFGAIFFLLFTFAGLTSTISVLETSVSYLIDDKNINRVKSTILSSIGIFIISIISSLSLGNLGSTINSVGA